jgi:putative NADPH-quinone reductase
MKKSILVINGHPNPKSLCQSLSDQYAKASLDAGFKTQQVNLHELKFNPNLNTGYKSNQDMEPDLIRCQHLIQEANHLVFVFPSWWASLPAILKGFIDRVFLPGFSFQYQEKSPFPKQLLKGKSARLIITMDAPKWYYLWINGAPGVKIMKKGTLEFCGVSPVKVTIFDHIRKSKPETIESYLKKSYLLGENGE